MGDASKDEASEQASHEEASEEASEEARISLEEALGLGRLQAEALREGLEILHRVPFSTPQGQSFVSKVEALKEASAQRCLATERASRALALKEVSKSVLISK